MRVYLIKYKSWYDELETHRRFMAASDEVDLKVKFSKTHPFCKLLSIKLVEIS